LAVRSSAEAMPFLAVTGYRAKCSPLSVILGAVQFSTISKTERDKSKRAKMRSLAPLRQTHLAIDALIPIWEKVLDRSPVSPQDNFFDLGGDAALAHVLFTAIEEATGETLPVTTIYDAPTVAGLAKEMERISPRFSPLVLLRPGDDEPPLFMAAGAGGSIVYFSRLAKSFSLNRPIYAIEARGLDGVHPPFDLVEDMAESCLKTVQARQPHGPYLLAGHSLGGLVMLEVAQRLISRGENITLLALVDTYPHPRHWPLTSWIASMIQNTTAHISTAAQLRKGELLPYIRERYRNLLDHVRVRCRAGAQHRGSAALPELPGQMRSVAESSRMAWTRYRPCYYPGRITFLRAEVASGGGMWPIEPVAVWGRLAQSLDIQTVPGNHRSLLATQTRALAAQLSLSVERALAGTPVKLEGDERPGNPYSVCRRWSANHSRRLQ
jgi:thioesterase domain-containing protein